MRKPLVVKTRTMAGTSDLTLFGKIQPGLVPAIEAVSYRSRVKMVLDTLNGARSSALEYALRRPFSDAVERVRVIHSVRVVINEDAGLVMLAATFDGNFESYMRTLWQKVGALLDLIFCSTIDYPLAAISSYDDWMSWVRRVQVETDFFYATPGLSFDDVQYLKNDEALERGSRADACTRDLAASAQHTRSAEEIAWQIATDITTSPPSPVDALSQGIQALTQLYKLTDLFPPGPNNQVKQLPGGDDASILHRASRDLLLELVQLQATGALPPVNDYLKARFGRQLAWLAQPYPPRSVPMPPVAELPAPQYDAGDVQGGILSGPDLLSHGALLLIGLDSAAAGAALLQNLLPQLTLDGETQAHGDHYLSVSITYEGFRQLGLTETELAAFPLEFRQGMDARSSLLGDLRVNHPRRWRLPLRNWPTASTDAAEVELSAVHLIVQLRVYAPNSPEQDPSSPSHPLHAPIAALATLNPGVRVLAVDAMRRRRDAQDRTVEHFGFVDGVSQPQLPPATPGATYPNVVPLGDLLIGYANEADPAPQLDPQQDWQRNGSFLALRKLSQNVPRLEAVIHTALEQAYAAGAPATLTRELLLAKLMGRQLDGTPLVATGSGNGSDKNDFDFSADTEGKTCPFAAHVRRVNPRLGPGLHAAPGARQPRIARRGMSYGPPFDLSNPANPDNAAPRGLYFMAYGATLAEQFETLQRWVAGANSSGALSAQADPLMGVPRDGDKRTLRFDHNGFPVHIDLDSDADGAALDPIVRLEWGMYLFTPSVTALKRLQTRAAAQTPTAAQAAAWDLADGRRQLQALLQQQPVDAWKLALEDSEARRLLQSAALWGAIRADHGGMLRTPYGVLVGAHTPAMEVFADPQARYSVSGYRERMLKSIGEIYLGLDNRKALGAGCPYHQQATPLNAAVGSLSMQAAFDQARLLAGRHMDAFISVERAGAQALHLPEWELNVDLNEISDLVLADLCQQWFGLGSDANFTPGSIPLDGPLALTLPLRYPGHFTAPSRYIFQAHPEGRADTLGQSYGQALRAAMTSYVSGWPGAAPTAPIAAAIHSTANQLFPGNAAAAADWSGRNMVGVLMGMLPTASGQLLSALNEWLLDGTFWRLRTALAQQGGTHDLQRATELLLPALTTAMQLRPVPELVWRTAEHAHELAGLHIKKGDQIVVGIVSASHEKLVEGATDLYQIFGGQPGGQGHACPGYKAAMGFLLGFATGILESPETMRPNPAPLALTLTGPA